MTGEEFKAARQKLGLTQAEMAKELGLEGRWDGRNVRRWESGDLPVPGPIAKLIGFLIKQQED